MADDWQSKEGMIVRIPVEGIRVQGRNTMGVRVMRLNDSDRVVSVAQVIESEDDDISPEDSDEAQDISPNSTE